MLVSGIIEGNHKQVLKLTQSDNYYVCSVKFITKKKQ